MILLPGHDTETEDDDSEAAAASLLVQGMECVIAAPPPTQQDCVSPPLSSSVQSCSAVAPPPLSLQGCATPQSLSIPNCTAALPPLSLQNCTVQLPGLQQDCATPPSCPSLPPLLSSLQRCRQDGMCQNVFEEKWDAAKRKFFCRRLPNTDWCTCAEKDILCACRNSFLCRRTQVPACILTANQGRCKLCADRNIFLVQSEALPRPHSYWECPGCKRNRRDTCLHPACRLQHAFCVECARHMLLLSRDSCSRVQCPLCMPLFDMGRL